MTVNYDRLATQVLVARIEALEKEKIMGIWLQKLIDAIYHESSEAEDGSAEKALDEKAVHHPELKWRTSVVDLMKLVGHDSGLKARERLAKEFGYVGKPATGEAAMNEFLHHKILERLGVR